MRRCRSGATAATSSWWSTGGGPAVLEVIQQLNPENVTTEALSLEEVFVATLRD
jgi:hypothetical protein